MLRTNTNIWATAIARVWNCFAAVVNSASGAVSAWARAWTLAPTARFKWVWTDMPKWTEQSAYVAEDASPLAPKNLLSAYLRTQKCTWLAPIAKKARKCARYAKAAV